MAHMSMRQPIRFGISLPNRAVLFGLSADVLLETAEHAEASGFFDSVWVGDNLLSKPRLESIVTLAALAARTRRLRLGEVCFASFTLRHPLIVAIQWASLDVLSGGRTILAVCIGGSAAMGPQFSRESRRWACSRAHGCRAWEEGIQLSGPLGAGSCVPSWPVLHVRAGPRAAEARSAACAHRHRVESATNRDPVIEERVLRRIAWLADGWQTDGTPADVFRERWTRIRQYGGRGGRAHEGHRRQPAPDGEHQPGCRSRAPRVGGVPRPVLRDRHDRRIEDRAWARGGSGERGDRHDRPGSRGGLHDPDPPVHLAGPAAAVRPVPRGRRAHAGHAGDSQEGGDGVIGLKGIGEHVSQSSDDGPRPAVDAGRWSGRAWSTPPAVPASEDAKVKRRIIRCEIAPGERLTEAGWFASRNWHDPEALVRLIHDRLVRNIPRHGYEVTPITPGGRGGPVRLRSSLSRPPWDLAWLVASRSARDRLQEPRRVAPNRRGDPRSVDVYRRANYEFHVLSPLCSGSQRLADAIERSREESDGVLQPRPHVS